MEHDPEKARAAARDLGYYPANTDDESLARAYERHAATPGQGERTEALRKINARYKHLSNGREHG